MAIKYHLLYLQHLFIGKWQVMVVIFCQLKGQCDVYIPEATQPITYVYCITTFTHNWHKIKWRRECDTRNCLGSLSAWTMVK